MVGSAADSGVCWPPPLIILGGLFCGGLMDAAVITLFEPGFWGPGPWMGPRVLLGLGVLLVGSGLALWALWRILRARTPLLWFRLAETLIQDGPFAWSRNPIYTGLMMGYVGLAVALGAWISLLLGWVVFRLLRDKVVRIEERGLERRFGESYRAYARRVRRWL